MKIGILVIFTGRYKLFFDDFYKTVMKNFLPNNEKVFFCFTDTEEDLTKKYPGVVQIKKERLGFPGDTLYRYKFFNQHKQTILKHNPDYLFYLDVDMRVVDLVSDKILPKNKKTLTCVFHPGFYNQKKRAKPMEDRKISNFYVPEKKRIVYFAGGFQGGLTEEYLTIIKGIAKKIDEDKKNHNIIPKFHDESAWNHYIINNVKKFNVVNPEYCYPEMSDTKKFKEHYNTLVKLTPRILALEKDHEFYRSQ